MNPTTMKPIAPRYSMEGDITRGIEASNPEIKHINIGIHNGT